MSRKNATSIAEIVGDPQPDDLIVEVLVRVGDGKPYETKIINVTAGCSRDMARYYALRALGLHDAKPGAFIVKSIKERRET